MKRIKKLQTEIKKRGLSAVLITKPENVRYLCGFVGTNGRILITPKKAILITDFRYLRSARKQIPRAVKIYDQIDGLRKIMGKFKIIGFEENHLVYSYFLMYKRELKGVKFKPISGMVEEMRMIKDRDEMKVIKKAVKTANEVFEKFVKTIKVGQTEDEMEWNLFSIARKSGADGFSFSPIICFGKDTADVHHIKSNKRKLKKGEKIMVDCGIKYQGYCTDMTRMIYMGKPTINEQKLYSIVLEANKAGIQAVKVGAKFSDIDKSARDVIEKVGFGELFGHATGHGVGLEVHEFPRVSDRSDEVVQPGMLFTIEPGVYSDKLGGGVRIEDMVYVNDKGRVEVLTEGVSKELRVVKV